MTGIYTIGHSTRGGEEFRDLLAGFDIRLLVDVRQFPGSRRYPHFAREALSESLAAHGIDYRHEVDLGGRRKPQEHSINEFWRNASFRAFAGYMASPKFTAALERLIADGSERATAIMCAEAVPWRCHRWLISDSLVARGVEATHIMGPHRAQPHVFNPNARVDAEGHVTYPGTEQQRLFPA
jgi:uncharacterized protein (DUF488 family)